MNLNKQQTLDSDPKAIQKINLTRNVDGPGNSSMFLIIEEEEKNILDFS